MCKGGCQPQRVPNATQQSGCVWERRSDEANEKYRLRYLERYAVRDDEGDCNLHGLFFLRNRRRTADYNPSVTSLRTGDTSPCTGEAFRRGGTGAPLSRLRRQLPQRGALERACGRTKDGSWPPNISYSPSHPAKKQAVPIGYCLLSTFMA